MRVPFCHRIYISRLWIPYIGFMLLFDGVRVVSDIFWMLTIHELGHVMMGKLLGYPCLRWVIYPFGLRVDLYGIDHGHPLHEICIAIMGPIMHIFIPYIIYLGIYYNIYSLSYGQYLIQLNWGLCLFNLISIYPLDGGRILKGLLHMFLPYKIGMLWCYGISFIVWIICMFNIHFTLMILCISVLLCIYVYRGIINMEEERICFYVYRYTKLNKYRNFYHHHDDLYRGFNNHIYKDGKWCDEMTWIKKKLLETSSRE